METEEPIEGFVERVPPQTLPSRHLTISNTSHHRGQKPRLQDTLAGAHGHRGGQGGYRTCGDDGWVLGATRDRA